MVVTEEAIAVAVQGTKGAYSSLAAKQMFPNGIFLYFRTFDAISRAVKEKLCRYGILPIENNTYGSVKAVYKILGRKDVSIVSASRLRIDHVLLAKTGTKPDEIRKIISHEQALGQCDEFLHSLGDSVEIEACLNTAVAARMVSESTDNRLAAISSPECAEIYGLSIIRRRIADNDSNYTRFICVAAEEEIRPEANRISLLLSLPHVPGALAGILGCFSENGINLLKIESTPVPGKDFEFMFYIDIEGSVKDSRIQAVLDEVRERCSGYTMLGCYYEDRTNRKTDA